MNNYVFFEAGLSSSILHVSSVKKFHGSFFRIVWER